MTDLDVSRIPKILGWGRPVGLDFEVPYCGITNPDSCGAVLTACNGRWKVADAWHFLCDRDRELDAAGEPFRRCGACVDIARRQRLLEGIAELKYAPMIETIAIGFDPALPGEVPIVWEHDGPVVVNREAPAPARIEIRVVDHMTPDLQGIQNRVERLQRAGDGFDFSDVYIDLGGES